MRLVARHAQVWNPAGAALDSTELAELTERLERCCEEIGRDPASVRRSAQLRWDGSDPQALVENVCRHHENGFTEIVVMVMGPAGRGHAEVVAERVLPELRRLA